MPNYGNLSRIFKVNCICIYYFVHLDVALSIPPQIPSITVRVHEFLVFSSIHYFSVTSCRFFCWFVFLSCFYSFASNRSHFLISNLNFYPGAQARDDQYEFECKQRAMEREERHRARIFEDMNRPPSPPPIPNYSDSEVCTPPPYPHTSVILRIEFLISKNSSFYFFLFLFKV